MGNCHEQRLPEISLPEATPSRGSRAVTARLECSRAEYGKAADATTNEAEGRLCVCAREQPSTRNGCGLPLSPAPAPEFWPRVAACPEEDAAVNPPSATRRQPPPALRTPPRAPRRKRAARQTPGPVDARATGPARWGLSGVKTLEACAAGGVPRCCFARTPRVSYQGRS